MLLCFKIPFTRLHPYCALVNVLCKFLSLMSVHKPLESESRCLTDGHCCIAKDHICEPCTAVWQKQPLHSWKFDSSVPNRGRHKKVCNTFTLEEPHQSKMDTISRNTCINTQFCARHEPSLPWVSHPSGWSSLWGLGTHRCGQSSAQAPQVQPYGRCTSLSSPSLHTSQGCPLPIWSPTPLCVLKPGAQSDQPELPSWPTKI